MSSLYLWYDGSYKKVEEGQKVKVLFLNCFIMRHVDETVPVWSKWICVEPITGLIVSRGDTKDKAIGNAKYLITRYGEKYVLEHVLLGITDFGGSPDYKKEYATELKYIKDRLKELNREDKNDFKQTVKSSTKQEIKKVNVEKSILDVEHTNKERTKNEFTKEKSVVDFKKKNKRAKKNV